MLPHHKPAPWLYTAGEVGFLLVTTVSLFAAILLSLVYIPSIPPGAIHWPALVILYWSCYQPRWQPLWLVFIMGIIGDLLSGSELIGVTSFIGVLLSVILRYRNQLILALPFWGVWVITGGLMLIWRLLEMLMHGLFLGIWLPVNVWLASAALSAMCFPLVAVMLAPLRRAEFRF